MLLLVTFGVLLVGLQAYLSYDRNCPEGPPDSLSFREPLLEHLDPSQIVIFTGGDSYERRMTGFANISANSISTFTEYHGYGLQFIDDLVYDWRLKRIGIQFSGHWQRVFAMPALRKEWPYARYFVWMDDDMLVPYPETDMLNHYVNMLEREPDRQMLYTKEGGDYLLNSGFFIMKNTNFCFDLYQTAIEVGLANGGHLARNFGHEQQAIGELYYSQRLQNIIYILDHRDGPYNLNTFARDARQDLPGMRAEIGDAFVHFLGSYIKAERMEDFLRNVARCRKEAEKKGNRLMLMQK